MIPEEEIEIPGKWVRTLWDGPGALALDPRGHDGISLYIGRTRAADGVTMSRDDAEWLRNRLSEWLETTD